MTTIAFVETKFVKKTVNPRFIHPASKIRSIPHRLPLRSRTYPPSPVLYLRLQGGFRFFFAHSSLSIHRLSRSHTLLQSRRPSVVSSAPRTHTGPTVLPLTAHRASRPHLIRRSSVAQCRGMYVPQDSPWRSEVLYEACIYMPSLQAFVETLRPQVLRPTHLCTAGEMVSTFWWTPTIRQAHTVSVNRVSLARRSNRAKSSSPPGCSGGGRECRATSEWGIGRFITNLIECL